MRTVAWARRRAAGGLLPTCLATSRIKPLRHVEASSTGRIKYPDLSSPGGKVDIQQETRSYEAWMRSCTPVIESHLRYKHEQMKDDPFMFFRGTYYRWAQIWPKTCSELCSVPKVLAVGDLHVGSYGTWRE